MDLHYAPLSDGQPSPGEVAWAWVPYEDDPQQGKHRPVLIIGREDVTVFALQLTSKDHDRDAEQEAAEGRFWMDIGAGPWDRKGRPSEVRLNRLLRLPADEVERADIALDQQIFEAVAEAARPYLP